MDDKNKKAIAIYDAIAEEYANKFDPIESDDDLIFPNTFLSYLEPEMEIVDLGCGTGFSANYFVKNNMRVDGVDLSKSMIAIAQRNYPKIIFHLDDIRQFKSDKMVDAVWAGYSLFHFEQKDFEDTLKRIKTYLKLGGILGIAMQEGKGEVEINEPFLSGEKIYIHLYIKEELLFILKKYGFEVVDQKIKKANIDYEFSFNKILLIAKHLK